MDKNAIIAIAAVAIIVVAGVCVFFALKGDDKKLGGTEVYSDIKVGDEIDIKIKQSMTSEITNTEHIEDFAEHFYVVDMEPVGQTEITYNGTTYTCNIYTMSDDGETFTYYAEETSCFILKVTIENESGDEAFKMLKETTFDVTKTPLEQDYVVGAKISFEAKEIREVPGQGAMVMTGTETMEVTAVDDVEFTCTYKTTEEASGEARQSMVLESITGDVYKFKDDDVEHTKDQAMSVYAYPSALAAMKAQYGEENVKMGKSSSETIDTSYGERKVTAQKFTVTFGYQMDYTVYYGSEGVIYLIEASVDMAGVGNYATTSTLLDCDAVKSL